MTEPGVAWAAIAALVGIAAVVVGVPILLLVTVGNPGPGRTRVELVRPAGESRGVELRPFDATAAPRVSSWAPSAYKVWMRCSRRDAPVPAESIIQ